MDAGRCHSCGRTFTAGEVAGVGILRPRHESRGGPFVEFECPGCRVLLTLVPHGNARYAYPGEPPPPAPTDVERRPPWLRERRVGTEDAEPMSVKAPVEPPPPSPREARRATEPAKARTNTDRTGAVASVARACAVLGVEPSADRETIERAYRARALQCHPDKAAHLDEEIRALAERKFKELQAAYELLLGG